MEKLRKWFNKPKKEAENQLWVQASTSERSHDSHHDDTVHIRILSSAPENTVAPGMDLRENLQEDFGQEQEVSDDQTVSRPLQTTDLQCSAEPPVCSSQVQVTNPTGERVKVKQSSDIFSMGPSVIGVTNTAPTSPGQFKPFFRMTDTWSLPSSPHPGGSRLPCSLPCSPLLRGRHWKFSPSSSSSSLSRLWVEEALQRSKNLRQSEAHPRLPCFTEVRPEGERVMKAEEGEQDRWRDESEEGYQQVKTENAVGTRPPDTVTFKPMTPSSLGVQERGEEEQDDEESQNLCLNLKSYCQMMPCVCDRCPSAPPFEGELVSGLQTFPLLSLEDFGHTLTRPSQWTDIQEPEGGSEQSVPRNRAPNPGKSSCFYPSLRRITPGLQNRKQEQEVDYIDSQLDYKPNKNRYHGNHTDCKPMWLSDAAGELQTVCCEDLRLIPKMLFDCSTCIQRTVFSVECCSFCSNKLRNTKQLCTNCNQVLTHLCPD